MSKNKFIRVATYTKSEDIMNILNRICNCKRSVYKIDGYKIKANNVKYKVFFLKGLECVCCCLKGSLLAIEKCRGNPKNLYHLNLYAIDEDGKEVMMTQDHIIPKSMTGSNHIDNLQTMCINCNNLKGDDINF